MLGRDMSSVDNVVLDVGKWLYRCVQFVKTELYKSIIYVLFVYTC